MNFNRLIPELAVSSINASFDFYVNTLGFSVDFQRIEDRFVHLSFEGAQLMLIEDESWAVAPLEHPRGRGINLQIETNHIHALEQRLREKGVVFWLEPKEITYKIDVGEERVREFLITDPDGYLLRFQQLLSDVF